MYVCSCKFISHVSRQNVLQFVYRYGTPVSFRFYFKAGTDAMEPRGYCFVEYSTREVSIAAMYMYMISPIFPLLSLCHSIDIVPGNCIYMYNHSN